MAFSAILHHFIFIFLSFFSSMIVIHLLVAIINFNHFVSVLFSLPLFATL